ncbi:hypothetical protein PTKIN_Ptkin02bG0088000 [Pterospermum kingtungense]
MDNSVPLTQQPNTGTSIQLPTVDVHVCEEQQTQPKTEGKGSTVAKRQRKLPRPRSMVHEHFTKRVGKNGEHMAWCHYCNKELAVDIRKNDTLHQSHI